MKKLTLKLCVGSAFVLGMAGAYAGGFQLFEESVADMGTAYSGTAARAEDATTQFYNPAGMTRLERPELSLSGTVIDVSLDSSVSSASNTATAGGGSSLITPQTITQTVTGNPNQAAGDTEFVPSFEYVYPYKRVAFGFGVTVPFGLATKYDSSDLSRFMATDSRLTVIDLGPSIALAVTPKFSLGFGLDADYATTTLNQQTFIFVPAAPPLVPAQAQYEGKFVNKGQDWAYGWNAGALYQYSPATRVGLTYRSKLDFSVEGPASLSMPANPFPFLQNPTGRANASFTLPDTANLSLYHDFSPKWSGLASLVYTNWSTIQNVTIDYSGALSNVIQQANLALAFRDTYRLGVGGAYHPNQKWTLRAGVAYDESPVSNAQTRTFRLPDNNRYWLALGGTYNATQKLSVDFGYAHLFVPSTSINASQTFAGTIATTTAVPFSVTNSAVGNFDSQVNEAGIQLNYRFGC